jgi:hypothetical protein
VVTIPSKPGCSVNFRRRHESRGPTPYGPSRSAWTPARRYGKRRSPCWMPTTRRITLRRDKNYDTHQFVQDLRAVQVTPPVAQHTTKRASAMDGRTTRHPGYAVSQQKRKRVEEIFGWLKTVGLWRKVKLRGVPRVGWLCTFAAAVYNLVRMRNLVEAAT